MKLLLDTHAFIWFCQGNELLSQKATQAIENPTNTIFVSMASIWEITIKSQLGKLSISKSALASVSLLIEEAGFIPLNLEFTHFSILHQLPFHHRDPFDRLLIAQAIGEEAHFVSRDEHAPAYEVDLLW